MKLWEAGLGFNKDGASAAKIWFLSWPWKSHPNSQSAPDYYRPQQYYCAKIITDLSCTTAQLCKVGVKIREPFSISICNISLVFSYLFILFQSDCFDSDGGGGEWGIYSFLFCVARCVQAGRGSLGPELTQARWKGSCAGTWRRKPSGFKSGKCMRAWALFKKVRRESLRDTFPHARGYSTCWGQSRCCPLFF